MRIPVRLIPQGVIPRDPQLVMRMTRLPAAAEVAAATAEVEPEPSVSIDAGADMFADATEIPYEEFRDVIAAYTYNKDYSTEASEPQTMVGLPPQKTAWWKVHVPAGEKAWLSADTLLSFGNANNPDTQLAVFAHIEPFGGLVDLFRITNSEDLNLQRYQSGVFLVELDGDQGEGEDDPGTDFYVQVGDYQDGVPGICYVTRFSLTLIEPGSIPEDGEDPDA